MRLLALCVVIALYFQLNSCAKPPERDFSDFGLRIPEDVRICRQFGRATDTLRFYLSPDPNDSQRMTVGCGYIFSGLIQRRADTEPTRPFEHIQEIRPLPVGVQPSLTPELGLEQINRASLLERSKNLTEQYFLVRGRGHYFRIEEAGLIVNRSGDFYHLLFLTENFVVELTESRPGGWPPEDMLAVALLVSRTLNDWGA